MLKSCDYDSVFGRKLNTGRTKCVCAMNIPLFWGIDGDYKH